MRWMLKISVSPTMSMRLTALLLVAIFAFSPEAVWGARRLFAADFATEIEEATGRCRNHSEPCHDGSEALLGDPDILDLLDMVQEREPVLSGPYGGYGGYGGYGCYGCYGCYGHHHGGYGDTSRESDADFEDLIFVGAALELLDEHTSVSDRVREAEEEAQRLLEQDEGRLEEANLS